MKNFFIKFDKKNVYLFGSISFVAILLIGAGIWYTMEQNHKKEILDSIDVTFKEDVHIEYGIEEIDYDSFITEKIGEPEIVLPTDEINTKELGKKVLKYELKKDGYSKEVILEIEIKDTKAPIITLKEDTITLEDGSEFNIIDNVESVTDPVDGAIPYLTAEEIETKTSGLAEGETLKGYYTVTGDVDTSTASDYTVTVKVVDANGNEETKEYTVTVQDEVVEQPQQPAYNGGSSSNGYTAPSGGGSSSSGGNNSGSSNTCVSNGVYAPVGNSGRTFPTQAQARAYADGEIYNEHSPWFMMGYMPGTCSDNCGNQIWTVHFYS